MGVVQHNHVQIGQKIYIKDEPCPFLSLQKFEKIQSNKFFNRMYGLTVNRIVSLSGHPLIINKIVLYFRQLFDGRN